MRGPIGTETLVALLDSALW